MNKRSNPGKQRPQNPKTKTRPAKRMGRTAKSSKETPARKMRPDKVVSFRGGGRNNELTKIAGSLRFRGLTETAIAGALQAINEAACSPPLDTDEVATIASSVARYDAGHEAAFGWLEDVEEEEPKSSPTPISLRVR